MNLVRSAKYIYGKFKMQERSQKGTHIQDLRNYKNAGKFFQFLMLCSRWFYHKKQYNG